MKSVYRDNKEGKKAFTAAILAPLAVQSGYNGCEYTIDENGEEWLICPVEKGTGLKICVSADSCIAMAKDLLQKL